jgi:hypothetical protein
MTDEHPAISSDLEIREELLDRHGELMSGRHLRQCLGFANVRAFRRAIAHGAVPVVTFTLPGRRGRFARTRDVAAWLATLGKPVPSSL